MLIGHQAVAFAAKRFLPEYSLGLLLAAATCLDILSAVAFLLLGGQPGGEGVAGAYPAPAQALTASHAFAVAAVCSAAWVGVLRLRAGNWKPALAIGLLVFSHWLLDLIVYPSGLQLYPGGVARIGLGSWYPEGFGLILEGVALAVGLWLYLSGTKSHDLTGRYGCFAYAVVLAGGYLAVIFRVLPPDDQLLTGISVSTLLLPMWAAWFDEHRSVKESAGAGRRAAVGGLLLAVANRLQRSAPRGRSHEIGERPSPLGGLSSQQTAPRNAVEPDISRDEWSEGEPGARGSEGAADLSAQAWSLGMILRLSLLILLPLLAAIVAHALVRRAFQGAWNGRGEAELAREAGLRPKEDFDAGFRAAGERDPAEKIIEEQPAPLRSALRQYRMLSDDIASILGEGLEDKMRIGGALAVATTNWQFNRDRWVFRTPEELGFEKIMDKQSLVSCVRRGDVGITALRLSGKRGGPYKFYIEVISLGKTEEVLTCTVPKGQVFELNGPSLSRHLAGVRIEEGTKLTQIYVNPESFNFEIHPSGKYREEKIAYCGNAGLDPPNGDGNLTVFKIADTDFENQKELHNQMDARNRRELAREAGIRRVESFVHASASDGALHVPRLRKVVR